MNEKNFNNSDIKRVERKKKIIQKKLKIIFGKNNIKLIVGEIILTIIASFIMAIAVSLFLLPNQLSSGGVSGIATITYYLFKIPMGTAILIINIPLFIIGIYKLGKYFFIKSVIGTITLSFFIDYLNQFEAITSDKFLACIYGGVIIGIGTALILKANSSTGGTDMLSYIAKEYNESVQTSNVIAITDIIIILLNIVFLKEIEIGLYSAIAIYLMGKIIDILFEGINYTKMVLIISEKSEEISKYISSNILRGITGLYGKGMYTNDKKLILMCAVKRKDLGKLKKSVKQIDKKSFIIITNSREVLGLGFKSK